MLIVSVAKSLLLLKVVYELKQFSYWIFFNIHLDYNAISYAFFYSKSPQMSTFLPSDCHEFH